MSTTEELRELEAEWMAQDKILAWPNWLQDQLLKSRQENKSAYSQGYKDAYLDALEISAGKCEEMHDCNPTYIAEAIRSLPIPEAQK